MQKIRVAVLRGGPSEEFHVSLQTGEQVISSLSEQKYAPVDVIITKTGEWLLRGVARDPQTILSHVDVVFIALHGAYGEDGQVQRLLDRVGVPYTGSKAFPSAMAMHKGITKEKLDIPGLKMARHMVVGRSSRNNAHNVAGSISELFGPHYVIKPIAGGSSIGTAIARNPLELELCIRKGLDAYEQLIVEEYIKGKEATCGVVENFRGKNVYTLPAIEIVPPQSAGYFAAHVKYSGETEEICPGRFSSAEKEALERYAGEVHAALGLSHYSRSDFIVGQDGIYFLEVNSLPGLTAESLIPKALAAVGCSYDEFIDHVLTQAFEVRVR